MTLQTQLPSADRMALMSMLEHTDLAVPRNLSLKTARRLVNTNLARWETERFHKTSGRLIGGIVIITEAGRQALLLPGPG